MLLQYESKSHQITLVTPYHSLLRKNYYLYILIQMQLGILQFISNHGDLPLSLIYNVVRNKTVNRLRGVSVSWYNLTSIKDFLIKSTNYEHDTRTWPASVLELFRLPIQFHPCFDGHSRVIYCQSSVKSCWSNIDSLPVAIRMPCIRS